jgi:8-oxo-dGTP pyrophosphatase MutT (NUDIX family)
MTRPLGGLPLGGRGDGAVTDVPADLRRLAARFEHPHLLARQRTGARPAAVLILLGPAGDDYRIVFVEKTARLRSHAGQIAFPGGSMEPGETDPVATALREAREEAGVVSSSVEVLGVLPAAHIVRSGFDVTSVVGWWREPSELVTADPFEIQAIHTINVPTLLDPARRVTWELPGGFRGPAFQVGELFIWGFTAFLLDGLFDLLGWTLPWDDGRVVEIPPRFFNERP